MTTQFKTNKPMKESNVLLTIFTESALETQLVADLTKLGARGYTITNARGRGSSGLRSASWEANSNIRLEVICNQTLAEQLANYLQETYGGNYAMVIFTSEIKTY